MIKNKRKVHLIPHTHWDREWYFTSDDSRAMLFWDINFLLDYLEKNPKVKFTYDGQSSIIDDYLQYAPFNRDRLFSLIKKQQLFVGPWYTQTDNLLPQAEAIVRNLECGIDIASRAGHSMQVGYLPDTFGHNAQTPQIMKMVGIDNFTFYRGLAPKRTNNKLYFTFQAPSGDKVLGQWQTHYTTSRKILSYDGFKKYAIKEQKDHPIDVSVESYVKRSNNLSLWMPIGTDMRPFDEIIVEVAKRLNEDKENKEFVYQISSYEDVFEESKELLKKEANEVPLEVLQGELREAFTGRVHRSILSSRQNAKQLIFNVEDRLIYEIEPLATLAQKEGISVPFEMINKVWKDVFKSSAHDSYGGSVEDFVNDKLMARMRDARRVASSVSAMLSKHYFLKQEFDLKDDNHLLLINPKVISKKGYYEAKIILLRDTKPYSFKLLDEEKNEIPYYISDIETIGTHSRPWFSILFKAPLIKPQSHHLLSIVSQEKNLLWETKNSIENEFLKISFKDGKFDLTFKESKEVKRDILKVIADVSAGDTYDHSPLKWQDKVYRLETSEKVATLTNQNMHIMKVKLSAILPNGLNEWESRRTSQKQEIDLAIILIDEDLYLKVKTVNKTKNLRLRIHFLSGKVHHHYEHDSQYYVTNREVAFNDFESWKKENQYNATWEEYPSNLHPHLNFMKQKENNFSVISQGTREHELVVDGNQNYLALTLFRGVDVFGKRDLLHRPGRASGAETEAPKAQMLDEKFTYTFALNYKELSNYELFEKAQEMKPMPYYQNNGWALERVILRWQTNDSFYIQDSNEKLALNLALPKGLILVSQYVNYQNEFVIRLLNVTEEAIEYSVPNTKFGHCVYDLNSKGTFKVKPWRTVTLKVNA